MNTIIPINLYQVPTINPLYKPDYLNHLIENGIIQDFFIPGVAAQNPILSQVNNLNENIGILQTATNSIEKILNYVDIIKQVNPDEKEVISELVDEINKTIKSTTFNTIPVFNQTLKIGNKNINLSLPLLDLNHTTIEDYEKILTQKQKNIFSVLENISIEIPTKTHFNPFDTQTFENLLNSGLLSTAYKENLINPLTLELLLS